MKFIKIGELAKRTGITVRALHHYDEMGLLTPSHRTDASHRLYGIEEIQKLQRIILLVQMGFSLSDIKQCLENSNFSFQDVLNSHIIHLQSELKLKNALCDRLNAISQALTLNHEITLDDFIQMIEVMVMYEKYYSKEQLEYLKKRQEMLGENRRKQVEEEWSALFQAISEKATQGFALEHPDVVKLGKQANRLIEEFTGGDPGIIQSFQKMYSTEGGSNVLAQHGVKLDQKIFDYLKEAMRFSKTQ